MSNCEVMGTCPFFKDMMRDMPAMAEHHKLKYCQGEPHACARFVVYKSLGRDKVPADLFPIEHDRARRIIEG